VADVIADWKKTPGTVGIRIIMTKEAGRDPNDPGITGKTVNVAGMDVPFLLLLLLLLIIIVTFVMIFYST